MRRNTPLKELATIAAPATASGRGSVGIIRVSGNKASEIAKEILGFIPKTRYAAFANFLDHNQNPIDQGIALLFKAPNSFTGEDVLELHGHGGPVIQDLLLQRVLALGAILARPGEFSERAFLNGKLDLVQLEAIADLINANSAQAANFAMQSLQGKFSEHISQLLGSLTKLRTYLEAAIDFTEEEIDAPKPEEIGNQIRALLEQIKLIQQTAQQGILTQEGISVVITGQPNVGKSSLLNCLCGHDRAIVTPIAGTTRDTLKEPIDMDGLLLHIVDTAGLRVSDNEVEAEGIKRAWNEITKADLLLLVTDNDEPDLKAYAEYLDKIIIVRNKIDLAPNALSNKSIAVSAKTGAGLEELRKKIQNKAGFITSQEGKFSARRRHLTALEQTEKFLSSAYDHCHQKLELEIIAEELRQAQNSLGSITGNFCADDLLDQIFREFCLGK